MHTDNLSVCIRCLKSSTLLLFTRFIYSRFQVLSMVYHQIIGTAHLDALSMPHVGALDLSFVLSAIIAFFTQHKK